MLLKTKKPETAMATLKKGIVPSVFSNDINLLGTIVSEGTIDFGGTLDGSIRCQCLTVRADGNVSGEIFAESVFVYGHVKGTIRARDVHLFSTCHIEGTIMHESLSMEDGAYLDGSCKRLDRTISADAVPAPDDTNTREILESLRLVSV